MLTSHLLFILSLEKSVELRVSFFDNRFGTFTVQKFNYNPLTLVALYLMGSQWQASVSISLISLQALVIIS